MNMNKGFTLVEIMIAAAMLAGLAVVGMQLSKNTAKSSSKMNFDTDVTLTTNEINAILSDPQKCLHTLGGTGTISSIDDGKYFISSHASAPAQGYGNAGLRITSYNLSVSGNAGTLAILYENKNILKGSTGPANITKNINLFVEVTAGAITKCRSLSTASADIWRRQTPGSGIYFNEGNVGIGTTNPSATLEINGELKLKGVTVGSNCSNLGAQAYNSSSGAPAYCNGTIWIAVGGGATTGMIAYFTTANCPTGWIPANGTAGTPDLRGEFIRGFDNGRGVDSGRVLGSFQAATGFGLWVYQGAYLHYQNVDSISAPGAGISRGGVAGYVSGQQYLTTRPRNVALLACVAQ